MNNIKVSLPNHPASSPTLTPPIPQVPIHINSAIMSLQTHIYSFYTKPVSILTLLSAAAHTAVIFPPYTQHCTIIY